MRSKSQNIFIAIDASSSMAESFGFGTTTKIQAVNDGVEMMLPILSRQPGTMIGLVGYNERPFVIKPLTFPNNRELLGKVKSVCVGGMTNLLGGAYLACNLLIKRPNRFHRRIILLTDGHHNIGMTTLGQLISKAQSHRIVIDTIGIGNNWLTYNKDLLTYISRHTGGEFIAVKNLPKLLATFRRLSSSKPFKTDSGKSKVASFNLFRSRRA